MKNHKNNKLVYIVEVIIRNDQTGEILCETVGVYDNVSLAEEYRNKCEKDLKKEDRDVILYDVRSIVLNRMPEVLNPHVRETEELTLRQLSSGLELGNMEPDIFEEAIIEMMNRGHIDQLIGEDGQFYYHLTEEGKKAGKELFIQDLKMELDEEDKEKDEGKWWDKEPEDEEDWDNFL